MWEQRLPAAYKPMTQYNGPINYEWQRLWDSYDGIRKTENLPIEKSHFAISLTPRSPRMEYGLELTQRLIQEIKTLVHAHEGKFVTFRVSPPKEKARSDDEVYVFNGKYYRTSEAQFAENMGYINADTDHIDVKTTLEQWRVGTLNAHLNEHATDEAMEKLAEHLAQKTQSGDVMLQLD